MKKYRFKVSQEAVVWIEDVVEVTARTREEARKIVEEKVDDETLWLWPKGIELVESGTDYDTAEYTGDVKIEDL